jgi:signal transduction histidine kinase
MTSDAGRWAAVLGHELRNPLAAALTGAAVVRELLDPGDPRLEVAEGVLRDLGRLSHLLDSYLDFARAGRIRRERLGLRELCRTVARRRLGAVVVDVPEDLAVRGCGQLLERALDNLIDNALQAGARGVRLYGSATGTTVTLCVDDDGPGVPADLREHLFRPGCSGRGSTGLGLCIVAEVVAGHGGRIACEPLPRGTRFCIELPAATVACAQPA